MAVNATKLRELNEGEEISYVDPPLDAKGEVWFWAAGYSLRIHSDGKLFKGEASALPGKVTERHTLYRVADSLVVDVEVRGAAARVRRGLLNGRLVHTTHAADEVPALLEKYRALTLRDGSAWNASSSRVLVREYRKKQLKWTVHVDGSSVFENWRDETKTASREEAIALAEKRIAAKEKQGFTTTLIELTKAEYANPELKKPVKAAAPVKFAKPTTPFEAVDVAVALLRDLHVRRPLHHFVTECLELPRENKRIDAVNGAVKFFKGLHKERLGRWNGVKASKPKKHESSWAYFVRVYGSLTWVLAGEAGEDLPCFYCGNVSGGGWSPLEISEGQYELEDLIEATGDASLSALQVFHGGWHTGYSFAFDTRTASPDGEHAIVPFDEGAPSLPKKAKVVPFGNWLYARVKAQLAIVEKNLNELD